MYVLADNAVVVVCMYVVLGEWVRGGVCMCCVYLSECGCTTPASVCVLYVWRGRGRGRWFVSGSVEMYRVCMYVRMHWCFVYRASYGSAEQSNARISDLNEKVDNVSSTNNCVDIV